MYSFIEKTGGYKAIYAFVQAEEESNVKAARIRIAKNLVKAGFATEIIYRATGLSIDKYDNKKEKGSERSNEGQEIKKWKRLYTRRISKKA
ncbi:hypothetical protein [Wolbachia endosymbiont of Bemisia tabaci]|uniref:hypothetical protein n=1 Tax=Wolbachia endosymbiont of Bemisia tabaci TaxID=215173 RepID=UPI0021082E06|nr:hypothetical protein [Wolbachia endosymbiont of Bemisia tabaci]